jgi:hypothetical protein
MGAVSWGIHPFQERVKTTGNTVFRPGDAVILEPLRPRVWPQGYWGRWGKASRGLDPIAPLA